MRGTFGSMKLGFSASTSDEAPGRLAFLDILPSHDHDETFCPFTNLGKKPVPS